MKTIRLNNGVMMPAVGFGVYQIAPEATERAVGDALEVGYRMIDTAASYFNEEQVGNAIRSSGLKREELFVTTKLWVQDYEYDDALRAFDRSMKALGLDYLERLQDLFLHNEVKPAVNQIETNPFYQQAASNAFLAKEGIQHEAWAPFAEGQNDIFNNPVLKTIAGKHGKTVAAVILRWLNQRGIVVIPKSVRKERMAENLNIFDFTLTGQEMRAIAGLDTGKSPIYDDMDLATTRFIGTHRIHE